MVIAQWLTAQQKMQLLVLVIAVERTRKSMVAMYRMVMAQSLTAQQKMQLLVLVIAVVPLVFGETPDVNKTLIQPVPCNKTVMEQELRACEHDMIKTMVNDHSTNCSTESVKLENCIKSVMMSCFTSFLKENPDMRGAFEESIELSVKEFQFGRYYCNPGDIKLDWESVSPKLRDAIPCDKELFQQVAQCGEIFRYVFAENRIDSNLCSLYKNAKNCTRYAYEKHCTIAAPVADAYNPFCPGDRDPVESKPEGAWTRVTRSWIEASYKTGVAVRYHDNNQGLTINARVTSGGCGKRTGSALLVHIKNDWKVIMYTQEFRGSASCWRLFGNRRHNRYFKRGLPQTPHGLMDFDTNQGHAIFNQYRMGGLTKNSFDGSTYRCDDRADNFWHAVNGQGLRRATVKLTRSQDARRAGIYTATNCGKPSYVIKDIFVYI